MRKKSIPMLSVVMTAALMFAGCGKSDQTNSKVLNVQVGAEDYSSQLPGFYKELKGDFEKEHPGVTVKYTAVPYDQLRNKQLVQLQSGDVPDLAYSNWVKEAASKGLIEDLTPYISKWDKLTDLSEGQKSRMQYNRKYYAYTWRNNSLILYYNKDIFAKAGITNPPTTWDELEADSKKIKDANLKTSEGKKVYALSWPQVNSVWNDATFLFGAGAKEFSDDSKRVTLDSPEAINGMTFFQSLIKNGYMNAEVDYSTNQSLFTNGQAAMWVSGDWDWPTLSKSAVKDNIEVAMLPSGTKGFGAPLGGVDWVVFKGSKNVKLANEFMQTMISPKYEKYLMENNSTVPTLKSSYELPIAKENKVISTVGQTVQKAQFVYLESPWMKPELSAIWGSALERILVKGEDVSTVLKEETAKMNEMLRSK